MKITETFPAPRTEAERLLWSPAYLNLSRQVYASYKPEDARERAYHVDKLAKAWGITRACSEAILSGQATYIITFDQTIITRTVVEE